MATLGLRHAVLWVSDPVASARFYEQALGLETKVETEQAVFMASPESLTDHDLGLFRATGDGAPPRHIGMYHLAWEVATLQDLADARKRLTAMGAFVGESNHGVSRSVYCQDPDGLEFEIMWELPLDLYQDSGAKTAPLDLDADIAEWGSDRPGRGAQV